MRDGVVAVRDTKDRSQELVFGTREWAMFVAEVKSGSRRRALTASRSRSDRAAPAGEARRQRVRATKHWRE